MTRRYANKQRNEIQTNAQTDIAQTERHGVASQTASQMTFQEIILRLQRYWEEEGALIWQPYSEKVGAGTMNPATILRVLGPEPWNVAYVEPSFRPDDGRYADNPNRMQMHTQFQVILKPDPGDPQERYLRSLEALGIRREEHDIRFVEDNWESPALGAWGLGWEVWLDGMEITQFTYFQQAGGIDLNPPAVEITYGLERIAMYLQGVESVWELCWDTHHTYGEILRDSEVDYCRYNFELADIERLRAMYRLFEGEGIRALEAGLVVPALDYILRCSHTFNILDARGAVGVTERTLFFKRMRDLTRRVATNYLAQRETAKTETTGKAFNLRSASHRSSYAAFISAMRSNSKPIFEVASKAETPSPFDTVDTATDTTTDVATSAFLLEIGTEELPVESVWMAIRQLEEEVPASLEEARLEYSGLHVWGTPRRLVVFIDKLAHRQLDEERIVKGPSAHIAFDAEGKPTRAAMGFARSQGVAVEALRVKQIGGGEYVIATAHAEGRPATEVLAELAPRWIAALRFPKSMRWDESGLSFSRPIRWLTALLGSEIVPFDYGTLHSDRITRGPRPAGSPTIVLSCATEYVSALGVYGVIVDHETRREIIRRQIEVSAAEVGGRICGDEKLLDEVTQLVEVPTVLRGSFETKYLTLPKEVLAAVMKKHQRYFPVFNAEGKLMPYFITVRNGGKEHLDIVRRGNENVIRARFADAAYFYAQDTKQPLESFVPRLAKLTFHAALGSMLDKTHRLKELSAWVGRAMGMSDEELALLKRAAYLSKADLATQMVVEMTSLQGVMGREYALLSGEPQTVAQAIFEHYLPRTTEDVLPKSRIGTALAIADRLDSLVGLFIVGLTPTGSADPYGLRRIARGLVRVLVGNAISLPLSEALNEAARLLSHDTLPAPSSNVPPTSSPTPSSVPSLSPASSSVPAPTYKEGMGDKKIKQENAGNVKGKTNAEETGDRLEEARQFIIGRLEGLLREEGYAPALVRAILKKQGDDPYSAYVAVQRLSAWTERKEWEEIRSTYTRCLRLLRSVAHPDFPLIPDPTLFEQKAEECLHEALQEAKTRLQGKGDVDGLMEELLRLAPCVRRFFQEVMVMTEDKRLRHNRLALLQRLISLSEGIVDLGEV